MAGAASQFDDDDSGRMITEINVTPLVDITLVLLIIFMVTTSYIVNPSIKVDLPKAATGSDQLRTTLALTLTKDGQLYLNGDRSDEAQVVKQIAADLPKNPDLQAVIAADKVVPHGSVVHIIDLVKRAGVRKFAINVDSSAASFAAVAAVPPGAGHGSREVVARRESEERSGGKRRRIGWPTCMRRCGAPPWPSLCTRSWVSVLLLSRDTACTPSG
jgi:biopolymer transport protein ExbD